MTKGFGIWIVRLGGKRRYGKLSIIGQSKNSRNERIAGREPTTPDQRLRWSSPPKNRRGGVTHTYFAGIKDLAMILDSRLMTYDL